MVSLEHNPYMVIFYSVVTSFQMLGNYNFHVSGPEIIRSQSSKSFCKQVELWA